MFGAVSGAHFNPVVTLVDRLVRHDQHAATPASTSSPRSSAAASAPCVANLMFELPAIELSTKDRSSPALWLSEVVATVGAAARDPRLRAHRPGHVVPFAVGAWIGGAYWFTSSTSFANPAVTVARTLSDTLRRHRAVVGADVHRHAAHRRASSRSGSSASSTPTPPTSEAPDA